MRQLVTGEQMKAVDQYAIQEVGIPSLVLMERAALSRGGRDGAGAFQGGSDSDCLRNRK